MAELASYLKVLISSKQLEFTSERAEILEVMKSLPLLAADAAEQWSPEWTPVEEVSVRQASGCAIYVGLFGCTYSYPTVLEYEAAAENPYREVLIYVKDCPSRDERLTAFLEKLEDPREGHTVVKYQQWARIRDRLERHLWDAVGRMVGHLLRLGNPPRAMGAGGAMEQRWQREKTALLDLGLPVERQDAVMLAEFIRNQRPQ